MPCKLSTNCTLLFGILSCTLSKDTVDVDPKVWGIPLTKRTGAFSVDLVELRSNPSCHHKRRWQNSQSTDKLSPLPSPTGPSNQDLR